ncbi:mannose-6-phosphate isomerase, partial [Bacteroides mediterraneensis]|nr:mannose-6-phosphate isomerase [Bacteroides mediterraneensis]
MPDITRDLIFPEPIFHEKIWGGRRLADDFGYQIPDGPIGECWAISAHPNGDCVVAGGAW